MNLPSDYKHRTVRVGEIQTHYLEAGGGPDLVLLHGGEYGASAETTWKWNIGDLAERFHTIVPDMLGYGLTDKIYSFSDPSGFRILHLKRFLEEIGVEKAYFVGNSAGGGTILRAAVLVPAPLNIEKMVTICGNAGIFKTESQAALESYTPDVEKMAEMMSLLFHDRKWLAAEFVQERYESSLIPGSWEALSAARLRRPGPRNSPNTEEFIGKLRQLRIPLLIVSCDYDPLNQRDWDLNLQKIVNGSRIHRFRNSSHEPQIEETDLFNKVLTDFLLG